jgi:catechol 2,3-dioxygenase-like lactoylglutathione lyase family enzyme
MSKDTPQVASFQARSLAVSLTVKDLQKSLTWYTEVLGFSIERNIERDGKLRGVALKAGEASISINQDDGAKGWNRIKGLGFSLRFLTDQSVDDIAQRIKNHGGTLDLEPTDMTWGVRIIRVLDPDGYKLSISKPLSR